MSRNPKEKAGKAPTEAERRLQRRAQALRSNLKRRKAAGRDPAPSPAPQVDPDEQ